MDNRDSTPERHDAFQPSGDRDLDAMTPTRSDPAMFEDRAYVRSGLATQPQETGMLDAAAVAVAIVITLGPLLAYALGYGA